MARHWRLGSMTIFLWVLITSFTQSVRQASLLSFLHRWEGNNNSNSATPNDSCNKAKNSTRLALFYNMYVHQQEHIPWVMGLAAEQFKYLSQTMESFVYCGESSTQNDPSISVHVTTNIGVALNFTRDVIPFCQNCFGPDAVVSATHASEGSEYLSLAKLWDHCQEHPEENSIVTYMHSKDIYYPSQQNDRLHNFTSRGASSKECVASVLGRSKTNGTTDNICDICSSRFSPLPHPHTPGNMWTARCRYVAKLPDPRGFEEQMNRFAESAGVSHYHPSSFGFDRYSAEHWVHCHPEAKPCDIYPNDDFSRGHPKQNQTDEAFSMEIQAGEAFHMEIQAAPRFGFEHFASRWPNHPIQERLLVWRLQEYETLYNNTTPPNHWYGWSLYRRPFAARLWAGEKIREWSSEKRQESHHILQRTSRYGKTQAQVLETVVAYCDADRFDAVDREYSEVAGSICFSKVPNLYTEVTWLADLNRWLANLTLR